MNCRHCTAPLEHTFLDLGFSPPSNAYLTREELEKPEVHYPLVLQVCTHCWLVQTKDYARAEELFLPNYAYFSSTSTSWLAHSREFFRTITKRLGLTADSFVLEVACNDGYLLKNFLAAGIPAVGIEPTASTAAAAESLGIPVRREFFGEGLGRQLGAERPADLIVGNNVFGHVPDINGFTRGLKHALKEGGTITLEFPHVLRLIEHVLFDTVYHEHFSYLSLHTVRKIFAASQLRIFDVEELPTHGGSLRVYGCHDSDSRRDAQSVDRVIALERAGGLHNLGTYLDFQQRVNAIKDRLLLFLIQQKKTRKKVAAYGAAAKGNTLLNFAGVKPDLISFVCDTAQSKQGKYLPGSHIPIVSPAALREQRPDIVLILPWNISDEILEQHGYITDWGGRFVAPFLLKDNTT